MNNVSKTLYIPLYGKAYVSQKGLILNVKRLLWQPLSLWVFSIIFSFSFPRRAYR